MKHKILLFVFSAFMLSACGGSSSNKPTPPITPPPSEDKIALLWAETITPVLSEDLWLPEYNYDAGQLLMVPLHHAFKSDKSEFVQEFDQFFERYSNVAGGAIDEGSRLRQLQFWYLLSQYLILSNETGRWQGFHQQYLEVLLPYFRDVWLNRPISALGFYSVGLKQRVERRYSGETLAFSYYRAVFDEEHFFYAIAADLYTLNSHLPSDDVALLEDILTTARQVYTREFVFDEERVLFQPGAWQDYVDYIYAGHQELAPDLTPAPIEGIALDSSHSHRFPLWLRSLQRAEVLLDANSSAYTEFLNGFENQFMAQVYEPISSEFSGVRMKNFMDGHNGVYRYRYNVSGGKLGYGPYALSGTLLTGFYPFMANAQLHQQYAQMCGQFPMSDAQIAVYEGLGNTRGTHPLFSFPGYFSNGFAELYCRLSAQSDTFLVEH